MSGSVNSGDLLGGDLGRWAVAVCVVAAVLLLVPIGLASVGFGAILAVIGGPGTPSVTGTAGQVPIGRTMPTTSLQPLPLGVGPIQSVVPAARGLLAGWADRGPLNQYARSNYRSDQSWATWRNADCSAAALDWLLGAYGQQLGSLDDAIALVGPGTGISPSLGLLDARGPALARALAARGLQPPHTGPAATGLDRRAGGLAQPGPAADGRRALVWRGALVRRHRLRHRWHLHPRLQRLGQPLSQLVAAVRRGRLQRLGRRRGLLTYQSASQHPEHLVIGSGGKGLTAAGP